MSSTPSWLRRAGKSLAFRLDRLRQTFDHFREQLHDAVSQQIGQTVAGAVREAVFLWLEEPAALAGTKAWRPSATTTTSHDPLWDDQSHDPWGEPQDQWDRRSPYCAEDSGPAVESQQGHVSQAVLIGCEAAAWWLRQRWGRLPLLAAFFLGGLAAAVRYVGGPLGAAGMALAGSAVSLMSLACSSPVGTARSPHTP